MILRAKFHVVSTLLSVIAKNSNFDAVVKVPVALPPKISLPKNDTTVNLKSASFVVIMISYKGLTHIQSQIKPRLLFGESLTLRNATVIVGCILYYYCYYYCCCFAAHCYYS